MGRTRLKSHHPALARGHHDGMGHFEALLVQAIQDLDAHTGAPFAAKSLPTRHGLLAGGQQRAGVTDGILHVERNTVG